MNWNRIFAALALVAASVPVLAATDWIPLNRKITNIAVFEDIVLIVFSPSFSNTQGCSKPEQDIAIIRNADNSFDEMISAALAAASADNVVALALNGCGGGGYDYPLLYRINIGY